MPTVGQTGHLRIAIYVNDHPPPHVHVVAGDTTAVVLLNCYDGPPTLRENHGLKAKDLRLALTHIAASVIDFCREWDTIHGPYRRRD